MKHSFKPMLMAAAMLCALSMSLTSCEGALDDILGEWSRPVPGSSTGGAGTVTAVTITTAPTATAGNILAGSTTALITVVTADGGTMMYKVTSDNIQPTSTDGFSAEIPTAAALAMGTYFVWYYAKAADAQHTDSEMAATPVEVTVLPSLDTPLTMEAITAGTIVVSKPRSGMKYSLNGGAKTAVPDGTAITVAVGDKVAFYGSGTSITAYYSDDGNSNDTKISGGTAQVKVYGNIMSLVDEMSYETATELTGDFAFSGLFSGNTKLTDASGLLLPATNLTKACYQCMFEYCTGLTTIPEALLPATTLANQCYEGMFCGCKALTTAPELKAETLAGWCYYGMFSGCKALTTAPELKAETLAEGCYNAMFEGCTRLTAAPKLPAPALAVNCYANMFEGCTSLTTAPELKATTLEDYCYANMFANCTSLTTAYVKAAYSIDMGKCTNMFTNCTATGAKLHTTTANKGN